MSLPCHALHSGRSSRTYLSHAYRCTVNAVARPAQRRIEKFYE